MKELRGGRGLKEQTSRTSSERCYWRMRLRVQSEVRRGRLEPSVFACGLRGTSGRYEARMLAVFAHAVDGKHLTVDHQIDARRQKAGRQQTFRQILQTITLLKSQWSH